ncbi:thymidylate synthase [Vibrio phage F23s1]|nr:thymidylate synthase [Vibrio phage F23s1]
MHTANIIAITKPLIDDINTAAELVGYCARVTSPQNQSNTETMPGLMNYCLKHKHFSIFEMANMVLEINTTRDISRQILRHRSFSYQEFSQRYAAVSPEIIYREARMQDHKNRQSSVLCSDPDINAAFQDNQDHVHAVAIEAYNTALSKGIAKEQARAVLPEGLTATRMYMNGTIRSWIHYCLVRCGVETQREHRMIAKQACEILLEQFPFFEPLLGKCLDPDYSAEQ